jgi:hypothetical protein
MGVEAGISGRDLLASHLSDSRTLTRRLGMKGMTCGTSDVSEKKVFSTMTPETCV